MKRSMDKKMYNAIVALADLPVEGVGRLMTLYYHDIPHLKVWMDAHVAEVVTPLTEEIEELKKKLEKQ